MIVLYIEWCYDPSTTTGGVTPTHPKCTIVIVWLMLASLFVLHVALASLHFMPHTVCKHKSKP